jgi:hypothetical protein
MSSSPYRTTQLPGSGERAGRPDVLGAVAKISLGLGCGCASLVALVLFVFFAWIVSLPESGAIPGGQMRAESVALLQAEGLLEEGERVVYYYDFSMSMDDSESCFFTDRKVVYHREDLDNIIPWERVADIDDWEDFGTVIEVSSDDGRYLKCEIAALNDGEAFLSALLESWERQRTVE